MHRLCRASYAPLLLLASAVASPPAWSQSPRPLSWYVPDDAGLVLQMREFGRHIEAFADGPLFARMRTFPPVDRWYRRRHRDLDKLAAGLEQQLGVESAQLKARLLDAEVLLAVWPPERGGAEPPVLLLARFDDRQLLRRVAEAIWSAEEAEDRLVDARRVDTAGGGYQVRVLRRGDKEKNVCWHVGGSLLAVSTRETIIRRVLELPSGHATRRRLADLPAWHMGMRRLGDDAVVTMFVNPRPWDHLVVPAPPSPAASPPPGQRTAARIWRATEYWVTSLEIGEAAVLKSFAQLDWQRQPPMVQAVSNSLTGTVECFERVPGDALIAVAARIDVARLAGTTLASTARGGAPGVLVDLAMAAGPNVVGYLDGSPDVATHQVPLQLVLGVQTRERVDATVRGVLKLIRPLAGADARFEETADGEVALYAIAGASDLPPGLAPAAAVAAETLFAGTTLPAVRRAVRLAPSDSLVYEADFRRALHCGIADPGHVVYVNLAGGRRLIETRRDELTALVARYRNLSPQNADKGLGQLVTLLDLADAFVAALRVDDDGVAFSACLSAKPR